MPAIDNPDPVIVPPRQEMTYDKVWITGLRIIADDPAGRAPCTLRYRASRVLESGVHELAPGVSDTVLQIPDLWAAAATDELAAAAVSAVLAWAASAIAES